MKKKKKKEKETYDIKNPSNDIRKNELSFRKHIPSP